MGWNQNIFSRGKVDENRSIGNIQYKGDINAINIKKDKRKEEIKRAHMHIHTSSAISNSVILESPNHQDHHKHKIQFIRDLIRKEYKWSKRRYINHKQNADLACISLDAVNGQSIYNRLDERKDSEPQSMRAAAPNKKAGNEKLNISASLSTLRSKPKPPSIYKKNKGNYPSVGILHQCKRPVIRNSGEGGTKIYKLMVKKEPIIHSRCKSAINYHPNTNKSNDLSLMKDKSDVKPLIYFGRDQIQFLDLNTMNRGENRREAILDLDEQAGSGMKNIPNNILNNIPNNIYSNQLGNNRHKGSISNTVRPPKLTIQGRNNNSNKSILDTYTSNNNSSFFTLQKTSIYIYSVYIYCIECGNKRSVQLEKRENHAPMLYIGGSVSMSANKEMRRCKSSIGNLGGQSGGLDNMRHKDSMRHKDNMRRGLPEINSQGISSVHTNNNVNKCTSIQNKDLLM